MPIIPLKTLRSELEEQLHSIFNEHYDSGWAVHYDYDFASLEPVIGKIERWNRAKHYGRGGVYRAMGCRDEMDAYLKAVKELGAD